MIFDLRYTSFLARIPCQEISPTFVAPFFGSACEPKRKSRLNEFSRPISADIIFACCADKPCSRRDTYFLLQIHWLPFSFGLVFLMISCARWWELILPTSNAPPAASQRQPPQHESTTAPIDNIDDDIPFWLEKIKLIKIKNIKPFKYWNI